jgi:hypothetical protein
MPGGIDTIFGMMFFIIPIIVLLVIITQSVRIFIHIFRRSKNIFNDTNYTGSFNNSNNSRFPNSFPGIPANAAVISKLGNYCIEFKFDTGDCIKLKVDIVVYNNVSVNDFGILITRGNNFVSFDKENYATYKYPI